MQNLQSAVQALQLFADPTRVRLVALLAREELTVAELVAITDLAQSRVSTHLARLRDAGVLRDRKVGTSTFYALNEAAMPEEARRIWGAVGRELDDAVLESDRERLEALLRARRAKHPWPESVAGEMERHYSPGRTWEATARGLLGLVSLGDVLDGGSGDGTIAELVAPRARSITLLDRSESVIAAAKRRLASVKNASFAVGELEHAPFGDRAFDVVLLFNVLTMCDPPRRALGEAARMLRPGGTVAVVTLKEHAYADVTSAYGHRHPGFRPSVLTSHLKSAGLLVQSCEVVCRERRAPHFEVIAAFAQKPEST